MTNRHLTQDSQAQSYPSEYFRNNTAVPRFMQFFSLFFLITLFAPSPGMAQDWQAHKSVHQIESETHKSLLKDTLSSLERIFTSSVIQKPQSLVRKVFGYHPYWVASDAYKSYDYGALSTIGYFSYDVDTATGGYTTVNGWLGTSLISYAHARGVRVVLVVTNFGAANNASLLGDTTKQNTLIASLLSMLTMRNGDGINIDFEAVGSAQRNSLVSFMSKLATRVREKIPGAEISMASPAVDWSNAWDLAQLANICDYLVLMGYDYYWSGSSTAGPVAPLEGEGYNVTRSVTTYLTAGVPPAKLLLGVPWYGYDWPVTSTARKATATGSATSVDYKTAEPNALKYGKIIDATTKIPWYNYQSGTILRQTWYDDSLSLAYKNQFLVSKNLGGLGIWALGSEGGRTELWKNIRLSFGFRPLAYIQITPRRLLLDAQQSLQMTLSGYDSLGSAVTIDSASVLWSYVGTGGSIQPNGLFTTQSAGSGTIIARLSTQTDSASITIVRRLGEYVLDSFSSLKPWIVTSDGLDSSGGLQISLSAQNASQKDTSLRIDYAFHYAGQSAHRVYLAADLPIAGRADSLKLDLYSNGEGHMVEFRIKDAAGYLQYLTIPYAQRALWKNGWKTVAVGLKQLGIELQYPVSLDRVTLYLTSQTALAGQACSGTIYIDNLRSAFLNNSPEFLTSPITSAYVDSLYRYEIKAEDAEGDSMALQLYSAPSWLHLDTVKWILSGIPRTANIGTTTVYLQLTDGKSSANFQSFDLTVKKNPMSVADEAGEIKEFALLQNYPNPFNGSTIYEFHIPAQENITGKKVLIQVFDVLGRNVATLADEKLTPGIHRVRWDAFGCPSGVYCVRMVAGDFLQMKKTVLLR